MIDSVIIVVGGVFAIYAMSLLTIVVTLEVKEYLKNRKK